MGGWARNRNRGKHFAYDCEAAVGGPCLMGSAALNRSCQTSENLARFDPQISLEEQDEKQHDD